jgi:tRNA (mo5U34)-methyltransferase
VADDLRNDRAWYHTLEFPNGVITPGFFDTRAAPRHVRWPTELSGGRCLDVGTYDGFWAFEMERRGAAEVVAIDVDEPEAIDWMYDERRRGPADMRKWKAGRGPGFLEAVERMNSRAQRINCSVYDINPAEHGNFDVVFCGALLLHLKDPVAALEAMRGVCRGHLVLVEALDPLMDLVARRVPAARFHPNRDQWWRVNSAGLRELVHVAGFSVTWMGRRFLIHWGPGAPENKVSGRFPALVAGKPWLSNGMLYRALVAEPRPPAGG